MTEIFHWPGEADSIPHIPAPGIFAVHGDVVWGGDGVTLITASQQSRFGFPGSSTIKPCPAGGPSIVIKLPQVFGTSLNALGLQYASVLPNIAALFTTPFVHLSIQTGLAYLGAVGEGGCLQPYLADPPGATWAITGDGEDFQIVFDEDYSPDGNPPPAAPAGTVWSYDGHARDIQLDAYANPLIHSYQQNWAQFPGTVTEIFPSDIDMPDYEGGAGYLGVAAPAGWGDHYLAIQGGHFNSFSVAVSQFAWWTADTDPEIPPPPPPDIDLTPPPLPSCTGSSVAFGGASAGTVPD